MQLRNGGIVRGNLFFRNPFGLSIVAGEVTGNAIAGNAYCWPRDGVVRPGDFDDWEDRGDRAIQVSHGDRGSSPTRVHGPVTIRGNAIADAFAPGNRAPIARNADADTPGTVELAGNVALNWHDWEPHTPLNVMPGITPVERTTDDLAEAETAATRAAIADALDRPRGQRLDVSGRVERYLERVDTAD